MKYTIIILISLIGFTAQAQFNTITQSPARYRIEKDMGNKGTEIPTQKADAAKPVVPADTASATPSSPGTERPSFSYPLDNIHITSPFGYRNDPFTGKRKMHKGIDLRANSQPVYAMLIGRVSKIGSDKRSGNYVKIRHGDFEAIYCHLSAINVRKGDIVMAGQPIAISGNTGRSTGPHLHLGLKYKGQHVNPIILLNHINSTR